MSIKGANQSGRYMGHKPRPRNKRSNSLGDLGCLATSKNNLKKQQKYINEDDKIGINSIVHPIEYHETKHNNGVIIYSSSNPQPRFYAVFTYST